MGQKVHPKIFRIGSIYQWDSKWFSGRNYAKLLREDLTIKKFLRTQLREASVAKIEIERSAGKLTIIIHSARPGVIIGRGGQGIEDLKTRLRRLLGVGRKHNIDINIQEVTNPNMSAELVVQSMISDLEKRLPYRRVLKQTISRVERAGAKGVKVNVAGRLNGAEIARSEKLTFGSLPLHTLRAEIDYARGTARTTYGAIGVKAWIYKGEKFKDEENTEDNKPVDISGKPNHRTRK
ncbi:30S ribosomal protein S3 [bacterium]|nr:30S ribosomal protein S3 [bacterium]|tara:strand:+ start:450 stop:1157 length:708 start_codon:yes stop_codon:yes gene_type:complete